MINENVKSLLIGVIHFSIFNLIALFHFVLGFGRLSKLLGTPVYKA